MLIYQTTGAILSNDELGEKHERTALKTVCEAEDTQRDLSVSLSVSEPVLAH